MLAAWLLSTLAYSGAPDGSAVALEPVEPQGEVGERLSSSFEAALRNELATRLSARDAQLRTCTSAECTEAEGSSARIHVRFAERERDYDLAVSVRDASGEILASRELSCEVCTPKEAGARAAEAAVELWASPPDRDASLIVMSQPPGAEVWVDGRLVGVSPLETRVDPGAHSVQLRKRGHHSRGREVELTPGEHETLRLELSPDRRAAGMRIAGWSLLGVGAGAVVGGIAMLAMDERPVKRDCSGANVDRFGNCAFRWNTTAGGASLLVTGLAAAGSGIALVVIGTRKSRIELRGSPTRASVTVRF